MALETLIAEAVMGFDFGLGKNKIVLVWFKHFIILRELNSSEKLYIAHFKTCYVIWQST